jgi:rfaE bifunctional protein nucleotidyltransferase chain/domain
MQNEIVKLLDAEKTIIANNIYIKNEIHNKVDYRNVVCTKPWGYEFLAYESKKIGIWFLKIMKGQSTSLHTHFNKDTFIIVIKGSAIINLSNDNVINLNPMSSIFLPHYNFHGLSTFSESTYLLEIEIFNDNANFSDKNDLLRINDQYKRKNVGYESSVNTVSENLEFYDFFNLDNNFDKIIQEVNFKVTELNENVTKDEDLGFFKKYNYNILLDGTIYQDMKFLKEGSAIKTFDKIQLPNDKALILSLGKINYEEDSKIIYDNQQLKLILQKLKKENKKIILSSGCFDILHVGHINTLREAKKMGDVLMICLSSDEQIKLLKGNDRPINNYQDRIDLFKTISYVDYIILYNEENIEREETLGTIMKIVDPNFWVKGDDYKVDKILEKHPYLRNIHLIKNIENKSTTNIINKIKDKS